MSNPYVDRLTSEHADKPKFVAFVDLITGIFSDIKAAAQQLPTWWDLDTCIRERLDDIGEWVGVGRQVKTPITDIYFSFDTDGLGFDEGSWQGPFDPDTGLTSLDDETYRTVLRAKIGANQWDGTIAGSKPILDFIFDDDTHAFIQDNQDMSIDVCVAGKRPPLILLAILTGGYIPLKPESVHINATVVPTVDGPLFGFDVENEYLSGFDEGGWGGIY